MRWRVPIVYAVWNCHPRHLLLLFGRTCISKIKMSACVKINCENIKEKLNKCVERIKHCLTSIVPCGFPLVLLALDLFVWVIYHGNLGWRPCFSLCLHLLFAHVSHQIGMISHRAHFRFNWSGIHSYHSQVDLIIFKKRSALCIEISFYF